MAADGVVCPSTLHAPRIHILLFFAHSESLLLHTNALLVEAGGPIYEQRFEATHQQLIIIPAWSLSSSACHGDAAYFSCQLSAHELFQTRKLF